MDDLLANHHSLLNKRLKTCQVFKRGKAIVT
jgi:hypothetical protein